MSISARPLRALMAAALMVAGTATAEPLLLVSHADPGPNVPPAGRSAFAELFGLEPDGPAATLPYPFERLVATLGERAAPAKSTGVLVPLGRSLQRHAADHDYFAAPRVVVAVTEDPAAGPARPYLADRLFLGFHADARVIEVVSWNEAAGRFEFEVVEDYGPGTTPRLARGERFVCTACHQGHGPIFADPLWSETGANPRVAARLATLGPTYEGVPTRTGVDRSDALDQATDRAARFAFAQFVWREACAAPDCRAALLLDALRFRLAGARSSLPQDDRALVGEFAARLTSLAPDGVAVPAPDLPNRDPLLEIEAGLSPHEAVVPDGAAEPTLPHPTLLLWNPRDDADALLAQVAQNVASFFSAADIAWLDGLLARGPSTGRIVALPACATAEIAGELRFDCGGRLSGHVGADGMAAVRRLELPPAPPLQRLRAELARRDGDGIVLELREAAHGLSARLGDGRRLGPLQLRFDGTQILVVNDFDLLRDAVALMAVRAGTEPDAALGSGPLRRRAILAELGAALAPESAG